jgi:outer membrane receptor protein involved in Fe transport
MYAKLNQKTVRAGLRSGIRISIETTVAYELGSGISSPAAMFSPSRRSTKTFLTTARKTVLRLSAVGMAQYYSTYLNLDYSRVRGIEVEYKTRFGNWFRGGVAGTYSIGTGKSSSPNENVIRIQQGEPENIRENYLIYDRPLQISMTLNFTVPKDQPLFDVAPGILDDWSAFVRLFYQSGKRYTPQLYTGNEAVTGRPQYIADLNNVNGGVGEPVHH